MTSVVLPEPDPLRQLALSTEESAVRERFDVHNALFGKLLSIPLVLVSLPMTIAHLINLRRFPIKTGGAILLLAVGIVMYLLCSGRSRSLRRAAGANLTLWIIGLVLLAIELFMLIAVTRTEDVVVLGTVGAWVIIFLWTTFARRFLAHAILMATLIVVIEMAGVKQPDHLYGPSISSNVVALIVGGLISRRVRRNTIALWSERHTQAVEQLRMRDELALARQVQLSMLPAGPPSLPWLDVAAVSLPATEVGGDYYDYFPFGSQMAIVCGDVAGHGFASGIVLAALRSGFTLLRESLGDPARVLLRLHELIEQTSRTRMLTTAAILSLDPKSRRAKIASAGHPPVMFRSNGSVRTIELFAPPLGVRLPLSIAQTEVTFESGDVFVLHTDGLYETTNRHGEVYGLDRLADLIERTEFSGAADLLDVITTDVNAFRGDQPQTDDVTIVVVSFRA